MTAETAIKKLRNRSMSIRQMANAIAEVTNYQISEIEMGDEEIEAKYTAFVINEANEYAK
ncbi:UDP-N-acetylenolpyruvoylglucosamine reductase [Listeria monocytogenes N53-1]|nr:UDP-N-acetylenolpyruvoylglucosamine reductase [Listeria monocytogenes N53-1]